MLSLWKLKKKKLPKVNSDIFLLVSTLTSLSFFLEVHARSIPFDETERVLTASDPRTRVECKISNDGAYFIGELMIDNGAQNEMSISPRKIYQLGLRPYRHLRTVSNLKKKSVRFDPPVSVELKLKRGDYVESRQEYLQAQCHLNELVSFLTGLKINGVTNDNALDKYNELMETGFLLPSLVVLPSLSDISSSSCSFVSMVGRIVRLSPRPSEDPDQRVVIGITGISKFHIKVDPKNRALEIEEECDFEG